MLTPVQRYFLVKAIAAGAERMTSDRRGIITLGVRDVRVQVRSKAIRVWTTDDASLPGASFGCRSVREADATLAYIAALLATGVEVSLEWSP